MVKLLVIDADRNCFPAIEQKLANCSKHRYQFAVHAAFDSAFLIDDRTHAVIYCESQSHRKDFHAMRKIVSHQGNFPLIYITKAEESRTLQRLFQLGVDDCLPSDELSPALLDRCIQNAIQRKQAKTQLAYLSTHDQLTGLANRYLLYQHLEHATSRAKRIGGKFAIIFVDIDNFKAINETLSHEIGDILLIQIAERLVNCVRETDIVARLGNDEFAILVENTESKKNLGLLAQKIRRELDAFYYIRQHELMVTLSMGIASFPDCGIEPETLLKNANSALHQAKTFGRNQFHFYNGENDDQTRNKLELEKDLRRALLHSEFKIFFQPQVNSKDGSIAGAEALLRWQHPTRGLVSPGIFIPLLEELGLLPGVEAWVIKQVCVLAKKLTDQYGPLRFSVNVSGAHFKAANLKENIFLALQQSELEACYLEVELTEDIMIEHVERNNRLLDELKELGISVALDDFGQGYSSLSYLKNFPADILKIDKAFIDQLVEDQRDFAIVESLIELSHKLNMRVVAEGVESFGQLEHLATMKCDYIQGFYFAKPMPQLEFENYLNKSYSHSIENRLSSSNR